MDEKELLHYGVPGMKWGIRKSRDEVNRVRRNAHADDDNEEPHDDYKKSVSKKSLNSMSTKEIQEMNTRIQAENLYRNLTMSKGEKFMNKVKSVMSEIATNQAKSFINHYADAGREKVQDFIDEKTGLGQILGLKNKAELSKLKSENDTLETMRNNNEKRKSWGLKERFEAKKSEESATESKKEESKKSEVETKTETEVKKDDKPKLDFSTVGKDTKEDEAAIKSILDDYNKRSDSMVKSAKKKKKKK